MTAEGGAEETHNVTSHEQRGGITAHTVNLGPQPGIKHEVLKENVREGNEYVNQLRLILGAGYGAKGLRIAVASEYPVRLDLHPGLTLQDAGMMMAKPLDDSPNRKVVELTPPLMNGYIATAHTAQASATTFEYELLV